MYFCPSVIKVFIKNPSFFPCVNQGKKNSSEKLFNRNIYDSFLYHKCCTEFLNSGYKATESGFVIKKTTTLQRQLLKYKATESGFVIKSISDIIDIGRQSKTGNFKPERYKSKIYNHFFFLKSKIIPPLTRKIRTHISG